MTISTKGRYALRIMLDLAGHIGETVKLRDIASRQEISGKYMEQIIAVLNGMILRLTEGTLAPVECLSEHALPCERVDKCATVEVYRRIYAAVNDVIDSMTLQDLADIEHDKTVGNRK